MAQKKLLRFAQIKTFANVLEYPPDIKGNWSAFFKNENPIILELACGRGEYTIGLAQLHRENNYVGIDIKGNRMYIGAKDALQKNLSNAAFLRTQIEKLPEYFVAGEVSEIWITFPDPQLRISKAKKRLTHPRFLRLYQQVLKTGGVIHLKTDSPDLYYFTRLVIEMYQLTLIDFSEDIYGAMNVSNELKIKTHYEGLDIAESKKVFYLQFALPHTLPLHDEKLKELLTNA